MREWQVFSLIDGTIALIIRPWYADDIFHVLEQIKDSGDFEDEEIIQVIRVG